MEIHGSDIVVDNWNKNVSANEILNVVRHFWKNLVVEDDGTDFFIYEDDKAKESWDKHGWSEVNDKTMVYVIFSDRGFTVVIDDEKENLPIANAIKKLVTLD